MSLTQKALDLRALLGVGKISFWVHVRKKLGISLHINGGNPVEKKVINLMIFNHKSENIYCEYVLKKTTFTK